MKESKSRRFGTEDNAARRQDRTARQAREARQHTRAGRIGGLNLAYAGPGVLDHRFNTATCILEGWQHTITDAGHAGAGPDS